MNAYEIRRAEKVERLRARAARLAGEAETRIAGARAAADRIPFGQPILVGHHSEGRDRRYRARIDAGFRKGFALAVEAKAAARRAEAAASSTAVSSDDPDAVAKLREKLAALESSIAGTVAANKLLRACDPPDGATIRKVAELVGWTPERAASTLGILRSMGRKTIATTNGAAERRRLLGRIAEIEARAAAPAKAPELVGEVRIEEGDNRVRVYFPGKPSEAVRGTLKAAGFRWSPTAGAWQRTPSYYAWQVARAVAAEWL